MKKLIALSVIVCFFTFDQTQVRADDSDIFGQNVQPNVLILLDSSGSMEEEVPSSSYNPATTYTVQNECYVSWWNFDQPCATAKVYKLSWGLYSAYANTINDVASADARTALNTVGYWSGNIGGSTQNLYHGNYLNYLYDPALEEEAKIDIAKEVLTDLVSSIEGVRFGLMKFNDDADGGEMVSEIGADVDTLVDDINDIDVDGYTPTGEQLRDAGLYYEGEFGYDSPIQLDCQPNFIIVVSDGDWNGDVDPEDQGTLLFTEDHSDLDGTQNVFVHTVGFGGGLSAGGLDALEDTAMNGGGNFYTADNSTELQIALQDAISQIIAATFTFASPVIPTTSTTGSNKVYLAAFQTDAVRPFWRGYLKAYNRDSNGEVPTDESGVPDDSALAWEAGQELTEKDAEDRTIFTVVAGTEEDFVTTNDDITEALLGAASSTERDKIIDFIRGVDTYDHDYDTDVDEEREWKLGDIFHANPVLVSPPFLPNTDSSYESFKTTNAARTTIVLGASNDGMLHAFQESNGEELWAFIPPAVLSSLKDLADTSAMHDFYIDSSPIVADIQISGTWKTVVVFGQRRGGNNYYALDITDTTDPIYLWAFTDTLLGETWSEPAIGKIQMDDESTKWVAFVGGGYDTASNNTKGKALLVIDLATGTKLWEYYNSDAITDRQYMNFSIATTPAIVDMNSDGFIDRVYVGDVGGQLWKFDVSAAATLTGGLVDNWTGKRLFAASPGQANPPAAGEYYPAQAIYATPTMTYDESGVLWVFFGTGDRNHPNNESTNRFYGIKENTDMTNGQTLDESDLVNVTDTYETAGQGWYFTLASDEKVLAAATVFNKVVFFSTFTPTETASCTGGGGIARLCGVGMLTGYAGVNWDTGEAATPDIGDDGDDLSEAAADRSIEVGTGIASKPVVVITQSGATVTSSVIAATTDQQLMSNPAPPPALKRVLYWKEVF
jgi:type IV pilus assembly protein PilY1